MINALYLSLVTMAIAMGYGISAGVPNPSIVAGVALVVLILLVSAVEAFGPFEQRWRPTPLDLRDDAVFFATTLVASFAGSAALTWVRREIAPAAVITSDPAVAYPLALLAADLAMYWLHRAFHQPILGNRLMGLLWPLHRVHHMEEKLYIFNNSRMHPLNQMLNSVGRAGPLVLLGFPESVCAGAVFAIGCASYLAHANIDVNSRGLSLVLNTPAFHRVHHSREPGEALNFGSLLSVWDHLFGTYVAARVVADIGIPASERRPPTLLARFLRP